MELTCVGARGFNGKWCAGEGVVGYCRQEQLSECFLIYRMNCANVHRTSGVWRKWSHVWFQPNAITEVERISIFLHGYHAHLEHEPSPPNMISTNWIKNKYWMVIFASADWIISSCRTTESSCQFSWYHHCYCHSIIECVVSVYTWTPLGRANEWGRLPKTFQILPFKTKQIYLFIHLLHVFPMQSLIHP